MIQNCVFENPEQIIGSWTVYCFEIREQKTNVDIWEEFKFDENLNVDIRYYSKVSKQLVSDSVERKLILHPDKNIYIVEGNRTLWKVKELSADKLVLVNDMMNLFYYLKRKQ